MPQLLITEMQSSHFTTFSVVFHLLYSVTNEEQYKKCFCNQSSYTMESEALHSCVTSTYVVVEKRNGT